MGRAGELTVSRRVALAAALSVLVGCGASTGRTAGGPDGEPMVPSIDTPSDAGSDSVVEPQVPTNSSIEERMRAGDYEGVLAAYASDSTLHTLATPTYQAAIAAAMPGHSGHDTARAAELFTRLRDQHPGSAHAMEADLYLRMLARERDLRSTIGRLDRELRQLKAIDLGQQPDDPTP